MTQHRFFSPLLTTAPTISSPNDIRSTNMMTVFNTLFPSAALSRAQISRRIHLSRVSVSQSVAQMIDGHLLVEAGQNKHKHPGKKGTLIRLDLTYWRLISIDLSSSFVIRGAVYDIAGHVLTRIEKLVDNPHTLTADSVTNLCISLIGRAGSHVLGIGVAVPGIIDENGTVVNSSHLGWSRLPLQKLLHKRFNLPCFVTNDANSALLAVRLFDDQTPNMIYVQITEGIGAAVLLDDRIVLGASNAAGEIGHVIVDPSGPECTCGKHGCLETKISLDRIRDSIASHPNQQKNILHQAGYQLGIVLAGPASLLNIEDVTIYGPANVIGVPFIVGATTGINETSSARLLGHPITVRRCEIGTDVTLLGEAMTVLQGCLMNGNLVNSPQLQI